MNKTNFKLITILLSLIVAGSIFCSCESTNAEIPDDLAYVQMIQRGQDAMANGRYKVADKYFVKCIEIYGDSLKCYVETRYELAQSCYKQKKYDLAKSMYNEIIDIFDQPEAMYQVQPKYKKLAQIGISKIEEKEAAKQKKSSKTNSDAASEN